MKKARLFDENSRFYVEKGTFFCLTRLLFLVCPPEGGLGSSWLKHASKQRSPTTLIGVVRVVVVLVLERVFVVGGEVVAATTRALAGRSRGIGKI